MDYIKLITEEIESHINRIVEQSEKIYTYGSKYDYRVVNNKWQASKKGLNQWFSMDKYPKNIANLDKKYPDARKVVGKVASTVKKTADTVVDTTNDVFESILNGTKVLTKGAKGLPVKQLQEIFIKMGYDLGSFGPNKDGVDGSFGPTLEGVIKKFQEENGLKSDGKVGKNTLSKVLTVGMSKIPSFTDVLKDLSLAPTIGVSKLLGLATRTVKSLGGEEGDRNHFVIYFSFPEYEPKFEDEGDWISRALTTARGLAKNVGLDSIFGKDGTYGKMGHAGVALVNSKGAINMFEFGRYAGAGKDLGITKRNSTSGAQIEGGKITNLSKVASSIKNRAQGRAKEYTIEVASVPITEEGYKKGLSYAQSQTKKEYSIFDFSTGDGDANCATFGLEVVRASTGSNVERCLPNPGAGLTVVKEFYLGVQTAEA